MAKDKDAMMNMAKEIGIDDFEIVGVVRLRSNSIPKGHLMRVQLGSNNVKRAILTNAKKQQATHSDDLENVYITPDLSVQERRVQKELRAELKRRRESGELNLSINRGKVNTEPVVEMAVDLSTTTSEVSNNCNG